MGPHRQMETPTHPRLYPHPNPLVSRMRPMKVARPSLFRTHLHPVPTPTPCVRSYGARRLPGASQKQKLPISFGTMR